ncbi:MAG: hypothetical protein KGH94_02710 [Candidatus Micrarchaeota archaeon]|nr:hypothetical protein [Candidatus Micrarchaeota archaeon]
MARFNQKVYDRRHERRSSRVGLSAGASSEYDEARRLQADLMAAYYRLHPDKEAHKMERRMKSAERAEIRGVLRRTNTSQLGQPFKSLKSRAFMEPEVIEQLRQERTEKRVADAVMERRSELARLVSLESRMVIMLLLNRDVPKTTVQLVQEFNKATDRVWERPNLNTRFARLMNATLVPAKFVKREENGGAVGYILGPNGSAYGQAISFLALQMQRQHPIHMRDIFGDSASHGDNSNGSLNRFLMLERISRGPARIKELCELVELKTTKVKRHLDHLKGVGILDFILSREDMIFGGFGKLPQRLAERGPDGITILEFKKLRAQMTEKGKDILGRLLPEMDRSARHRSADPGLVQLAKAYSTDPSRLGLLAKPAIARHLAGMKNGRNGEAQELV